MKRVATEIDPRATIDEPRAVATQDTQRAGTTFFAGLLAALALVAAFIAAVGIYGVTAFATQQREREIAIRMALGATGRAIVRLFLRESSVTLAVGLVAGLAGAFAASGALQSRLYGVSAVDAPTLVVTSLGLGAIGALATLWPARRAASRNPLAGLKEG
jgi:putative ABC transport system permease protein